MTITTTRAEKILMKSGSTVAPPGRPHSSTIGFHLASQPLQNTSWVHCSDLMGQGAEEEEETSESESENEDGSGSGEHRENEEGLEDDEGLDYIDEEEPKVNQLLQFCRVCLRKNTVGEH